MLDNLSLIDWKALSEPLVKLIDTIGKGLGMTFQSLSIYLNGKAEANRYLTMEKAKTDAQVYHRETMAKSDEVLQDRVMAREAKRQNNIKDVAEIAANELNGQNVVSDEPVSEDWITRFFNTVEDVSDDELKIIWGKILAGEVKTPGSYSLRTLETLKNLSSKEAEIFTKACQYACGYKELTLFIRRFEAELGLLSFDEVSTLMNAGLLTNSFDIKQNFTIANKNIELVYQDHVLIFSMPDKKEDEVDILTFTNSANELYGIVSKTVNGDFLNYVTNYFKREGADKISIGEIKSIKDDGTVSVQEGSIKELYVKENNVESQAQNISK